MSVSINVHGADWNAYAALGFPTVVSRDGTTRWKNVVLGDLTVVVFEPREVRVGARDVTARAAIYPPVTPEEDEAFAQRGWRESKI